MVLFLFEISHEKYTYENIFKGIYMTLTLWKDFLGFSLADKTTDAQSCCVLNIVALPCLFFYRLFHSLWEDYLGTYGSYNQPHLKKTNKQTL